MLLQYMSLASGSSGNCCYVGTDDYGILIDAGISARNIKKALKDNNIPMEKIVALCITHDHADHVKAVGVISDTYGLPVYATERVHEGIAHNYCVRKKVNPANMRIIEPGAEISLDGFSVTPFRVPHDSHENMGYIIRRDGVTFTLMTDIGHVTDEMAAVIGMSDYLVIESNYDEDMLWTGVYPEYLKKRVSGGNGHLSNKLCAKAIVDNAGERLRRVWLCHLSEENNHPELARKTVEQELSDAGKPWAGGVQVDVLRRNVPSLIFEIGG